MKRLLITHTDLDGVGSIILNKWLESRIEKLFFDEIWIKDYGFELEDGIYEDIIKFDEIWMYDISLPKETIVAWTPGPKFIIRDHHESALWLNDESSDINLSLGKETIVDVDECGTSLFYKWMKSTYDLEIPWSLIEFVDLVKIYDLWDNGSSLWNKAVNLNNLMFDIIYHDYSNESPLEARSPFIRHILDKFNKSSFEFDYIDELIIKRCDNIVNKAYETLSNNLVIGVDTKNRMFGVSKLGRKISLASHKLLNDKIGKRLEYLIVIFDSWEDGITGKVSVRSTRDDFNCNLLAGIEGHSKAAGGTLAPEECELLLTGKYCLKYKEDTDDQTLITKVKYD